MNKATRLLGAVAALGIMCAHSADNLDGGVYIRLGANMISRALARNRNSHNMDLFAIDVLEP